MHRCVAQAASLLLGLGLSAAALAQSLQRPFPATALRGELTFAAPPDVLLNGRPARLAPGSRIRGADNFVQTPASLTGLKAVVHYTVEPATGLLQDVWILHPEERARRPWPTTPDEAARWSFDPAAQAWSRP
ncbi:hypothetical protein [Aquabacterium sp. J223]|uniref:hypothetical protein n=1 Tax=Aquabacterium sp. J223 TaxID=2898431 RepID=UPI0021ADF55B|nr:hypothetical protein [Aquabacterium sp. J223]UUX95747.1 hypothetical protein LRS07_21575 [Aquabacterium sp. J223]